MTTRDRCSGAITAVVFDVVTQPPSGAVTVRWVAFLTCRPPIVHFISAGGLLLAVVHVKGTASPTLASVGPEMVTWAGATVQNMIQL